MAIVAAALCASAFASRASTSVKVGMSEFKFALSKSSASAGPVVFTVTNKGKLPHDFKIAGKKSAMLKPGKSGTLKVTLKKGKYPYICSVPGHAGAGMKGTFTVK